MPEAKKSVLDNTNLFLQPAVFAKILQMADIDMSVKLAA